jgi:hypothetical protein
MQKPKSTATCDTNLRKDLHQAFTNPINELLMDGLLQIAGELHIPGLMQFR